MMFSYSSFGFRFSDFQEYYDSSEGCFAVVLVKQPAFNFHPSRRVVSNFSFFKTTGESLYHAGSGGLSLLQCFDY